MKVRISYFYKAPKSDPTNFPEEVVEMTEEEFNRTVNGLFYEERADVFYTDDYFIGYSII